MDQRSLEKNLANIEHELVALQTAHDVGLGNIGFYTYGGDVWTFFYGGDSPMVVLLIDVLDNSRADPLMNIFVSSIYEDNGPGFAYAERVNGVKYDYYTFKIGGQHVLMHYKIVSSTELSVRPAESWQDYLDWINE